MNICATSFDLTDELSSFLGIHYLATPDPESICAELIVTSRACQAMGYLHGGVSILMAEAMAGIGSSILSPKTINLGIDVTAHHLRTAKIGEKIFALARIVSITKRFHLWKITIQNEQKKIISDITVRNYIQYKTNNNE